MGQLLRAGSAGAKGPSRRARDLFPTGSLPRVSRETLFPRHWGTDLSCSFTKARPPVHLGPGPQQSSACLVASPSHVYKAAVWGTDGGTKARRGFCTWSPATLARCGPACAAVIQAQRKALAGGPRKEPCSWANTGGGTRGCGTEVAESCAWGQARAPFTVWWPNTEGSQAEGHGWPWGPSVSSGMGPWCHLKPKAGAFRTKPSAQTCVCTHISVCDGRAACGATCQQSRFGHHLPRRARAPVANSC